MQFGVGKGVPLLSTPCKIGRISILEMFVCSLYRTTSGISRALLRDESLSGLRSASLRPSRRVTSKQLLLRVRAVRRAQKERSPSRYYLRRNNPPITAYIFARILAMDMSSPKCQCNHTCTDVWEPVCDNDGMTHTNLCAFLNAKCFAQIK